MIKPGPMPEFPKPKRIKTPEWLKRYTRMRQQRPTRKLEDEIYRKQRKQFLIEHPFCEVRVRADGTIAPRHSLHPLCGKKSRQVHHIRKRGKYYLDKKYWLATGDPLCNHHAWIEANKREAVRLGYLERVYEQH